MELKNRPIIGNRIKEIRKRKKLTQKEVAQRCGMADSAIRKYESGTITPKFETMDRIAEALEVPVTALMGYEYSGTDSNGNDIYKPPFHIIAPESPELNRLINAMDRLNDEGQEVALQRVEELGEIPKYQREPENKK